MALTGSASSLQKSEAVAPAPGDHGVALHRRWPDKRYRLFARDGDRFDFVGNSARRPGADQLRAIYAETTRHRVYDGS